MFVSASTYLDALFLLLGDNSDRSRSIVKEFLDVVDKQSSKKEITTVDDDLIAVYRSLIKSVIAEKIDQENETAAKILLLKIRGNETLKAYPMEKDIIVDVLTAKDPISSDQIDRYLKNLRNTLLIAEMDIASRKLFAKTRAISEIKDPEEQENEIAKIKVMLDTSMKAIEHRESSSDVKASESYVSMSDPESIKRALDKYMERSVKGIIKTGLQGLNKSLGARGGIGLGESAVFAAPSHHYKSGILVSFMIWTIAYNHIVVEPGKRALVYFVSLENEVHQNIMFVFKALYARIEKRHVDINSISVEVAVEWLQNYFQKFNIDLIIDRYNPHEFSYEKYTKRYNSFIELGYQVILFDLDYLSEAKGIDPGDTMSASGHQQLIKENYIKFCNHAKQQGYAFITGHQLNRKAEELAAQNRYAVKQFNPAMVADSSDVFRPVDIFFFMLLANNVDGRKFLTVQNRKNRGNQDTPDKDKFFAYAFTEFGIEDDIDDMPRYTRDIDAWDVEKGAKEENIAEGAMF